MTIKPRALTLEEMWQAWPDPKDPASLVGPDQVALDKTLEALSVDPE